MTSLRMIDWLKLAPIALAAALLTGCGAPEDATVAPVDEPIGADSTTDLDFEETVIDEPVSPDPVEPAVDPVIEPAPAEPGTEPAELPPTP